MDLSTNKRTRISPRTNTINDILALIDAQAAEYAEGSAPSSTLLVLRARVADMIGTKHQVVKPATAVATRAPKGQGKSSNGTHYVGQAQSGDLVYMSSPDMALNAGNYPEFSHIWGPFNTRAGSEYAIQHQTHTSKPQLF